MSQFVYCMLFVTSEYVKIKIGSAAPLEEALAMKVRGRDLATGLPKEIIMDDTQVREAMSRSVQIVINTIKATIENTPPELVSDIYENGLLLSGGGALLRSLDSLIAEATGIPVIIADDPLTCVVRGTAVLLADIEFLRTVMVPTTTPGWSAKRR